MPKALMVDTLALAVRCHLFEISLALAFLFCERKWCGRRNLKFLVQEIWILLPQNQPQPRLGSSFLAIGILAVRGAGGANSSVISSVSHWLFCFGKRWMYVCEAEIFILSYRVPPLPPALEPHNVP